MAVSRTAAYNAALTASSTSPATYTDATPAHRAPTTAALIGTILRARSSSRVPRCTRGHSRAKAHRNAGGTASASGSPHTCSSVMVGPGIAQTAAGSRSAGGRCPRKAGSMCSAARVARKRK